MPSFSRAETGSTHICGHRGNMLHAPENTLSALRSVRENGGSSAEIDVVLSADGELVVLHDLLVDRTSNGTGAAADMTLSELKALDAGGWFAPDFAGERMPTLAEAIALAHEIDLVLEAEIKEKRNLPGTLEALGSTLATPEDRARVMLISFDHAFLKEAKKVLGPVQTGGIAHERYGDPMAVVEAADLDQLCIDFGVFAPEDATRLHDAGKTIRCHAYKPQRFETAAREGLAWREELKSALSMGLIDTLSGDDVAWLVTLAKEAGCATS